ncbi:chaperone BCS1 [Thecamonas trahens ATCC 50062]|uniref:Chaperone BCS1 n=1 Tax=Thecamonas trahens ATCC 50062 TaxID=461836 RepID=A0A0L0D7W0_THETB|nr:chaperone BCS1 [Thecamonas trahens ATCC 50062]KNC47393.1 chaperone BCS1 [Thecamonas trahens ATCC 50062]|eukprot:XP_013759731.1 chaperone BCS1 [Thecamonas trahens ATCC 50062]
MEVVQSLLDSNPYFSAGAGLAGIGVALTMLRRGLNVATLVAQRKLLVTLEVTSKDKAYPWVLAWLNAEGRATQHVSVETIIRQKTNGSTSTEYLYQPRPGRHFFFHEGRPFMVERTREKQMIDMTSGAPWETVTITTPGMSQQDMSVFNDFLRNAQSLASKRDDDKTIIYTAWGTEWRPFGHPRRKRPLDSVILDTDKGESLVGDVTEFLQSSQWYIERGIPYRRGYLLHGPPGCGKSSFITALAGELDYGICILNLNDRGMTDDRLAYALSEVPQQCIVLLEDIDAAFPDPTASRRMETDSYLTFSGLLNTLDGVASSEDRLLFMTTNHLDRLDPALIRPGRVDYIEYIGHATTPQARKLFTTFYPEASTAVADAWADATGEGRYSVATLQGVLMRYKDEPTRLVSELESALPPPQVLAVPALPSMQSLTEPAPGEL